MKLKVRRTNTLETNFRQMEVRQGKRLEAGQQAAAEKGLEESQKLVPEDTGTLKKSGRVSKTGSGYGAVFYIGYGGTDLLVELVYSPTERKTVWRKASDYAIIVHERADVHHPKGQADYLAAAILTKMDEMRLAFREAVERA
jgi:hypothetical protein